MTKELDTTRNEPELMPMEPVNTDTLERLKDYAEAWGAAAHIAEQIAKTDFAGPFKGKPQDMAVAVLKGASLGIPPESIGKAIYVVHGTPALYGKTALSIALAHGYTTDTIEDTPEAVTVRMASPTGQEMEVRYTIERAEKEGLVKGNSAQYKMRPSKMLYWKCIGELTDRMIPHLTGGMPIKEDIQQSEPVRATATRVQSGRGASGLRAALEASQQQPEVVDDSIDELVDAFIADIDAASTMDKVLEIALEAKSNKEQGIFTEAQYDRIKAKGNAKADKLKGN